MNQPYYPPGAPGFQQPQQPQGAPPGYPQQQYVPPQQPGFQQPQGAPPGYPQQPPPGYPAPGFAPQGAPLAPPSNPNPFFNLNGADPTGGNNLPFLLDGLYVLKFGKITTKQSRKGKFLYIMELMVIRSTNPERPAGTLCSSFINLSHEDTRDRSMKQLIAARHGSDPQQEVHKGPLAPDGRGWDVNASESLLPSQPWNGAEIGCHVHTVETKSGDDFSRHDFMPVWQVEPLIAAALERQASRGAPPASAGYGPPPQQPAQMAPQGSPPNQLRYAPQPGQYAPPGAPPAQMQPQYAPPGAPPAQYAPQGAPQGAPPAQYAPQQPPQGQPPGQPGWPNWGR